MPCKAIPPDAWAWPTYLGWDWRSKAGLPIVNVPGCPVQPDNFMETVLYLLYQVAGLAPMIPLDDELRPTWLFGKTVHEGCDRAGYYEQGDFAEEYGSPKCIVKLGCWGPVVNCNVPKRGWMDGIGGCPNVGGICIGCTMPGFPDKFMPFMDEPPGARVSTGEFERCMARAVTALRSITQNTSTRNRSGGTTGAELTHWLSRHDPAFHRLRSDRDGHNYTDRLRKPSASNGRLVEMNWDPITRIVGSLGIFTKIDFANRAGGGVLQHLVHLPRLQHFHEGQRPAGRALHHQPHLRHLRRQSRHLRQLRAEHGLRHAAAAHGASGSSISAKPPSTCSTTTSSRTTWWAWTSASRW